MNGWAADLISQDVADKVGKCWGLGSDTRKDFVLGKESLEICGNHCSKMGCGSMVGTSINLGTIRNSCRYK